MKCQCLWGCSVEELWGFQTRSSSSSPSPFSSSEPHPSSGTEYSDRSSETESSENPSSSSSSRQALTRRLRGFKLAISRCSAHTSTSRRVTLKTKYCRPKAVSGSRKHFLTSITQPYQEGLCHLLFPIPSLLPLLYRYGQEASALSSQPLCP